MRLCIYITILTFVCMSVSAAMPDHMEILVPKKHIDYDDDWNRPLGAFVYSMSEDRFYISTFGSDRGIRCFVGSDGEFPDWGNAYSPQNKVADLDGKSWQCVTENQIAKIAGSPDILNGLYDPDIGSISLFSGIILNPNPVTVNRTEFGSESLAIISDNSRAQFPEITKRFLTWDLREINSPTGNDPNDPYFHPDEYNPGSEEYEPNNLPDMANAAYDATTLMVDSEEFGDISGYGFTDWNDAFNFVLSFKDVADAIGYDFELNTETNYEEMDLIGLKRAAFSTSGKKLYYISGDARGFGARAFTGIWSTDLETGITKRLFDDTGDNGAKVSNSFSVVISEPAVIPVGKINLTGLPYSSGVDQVLFNGTEVSGNMCGLNCLVDDGSDNPPIYPVIDGEELLDFLEVDIDDPAFYDIDNEDESTWPSGYDPNNPDPNSYLNPEKWPKISSITYDSVGNIYVFVDKIYAMIKFDTQGRLIAVNGMIDMLLLNKAKGVNGNKLEQLQLQTRQVQALYSQPGDPEYHTQVMFLASGINAVCGVNVYPPCDFTMDGVVSIDDMDFFGEQFRESDDPNILTSIYDPNFTDYIKADLNASGKTNESQTELVVPAVNERDVEVLYQFVLPGNVNMDNFVDLEDFAIISSNYLSSGLKNWAQGDFDFDQDVDFLDFILFVSSWLGYDGE